MTNLQQKATERYQLMVNDYVKRLGVAYDQQWRDLYGASYGVLGRVPEQSQYFKLFSEHAEVCLSNNILPSVYIAVQFKFARPRNGRSRIGVYDVLYEFSHNRYKKYKANMRTKMSLTASRYGSQGRQMSKSKTLKMVEGMVKAQEQILYLMDLQRSQSRQKLVELVVAHAKLLDPFFLLCFQQYIPVTSEYGEVHDKLLEAAETLGRDRLMSDTWVDLSKEV